MQVGDWVWLTKPSGLPGIDDICRPAVVDTIRTCTVIVRVPFWGNSLIRAKHSEITPLRPEPDYSRYDHECDHLCNHCKWVQEPGGSPISWNYFWALRATEHSWSQDRWREFEEKHRKAIVRAEDFFKPSDEVPEEISTYEEFKNYKMSKQMHVDPATGAMKQTKLARCGLVPPRAELELAERFGLGVESGKYSANNWRGGYAWSKSYDALCRHLREFWDGKDFDDEAQQEYASAKGTPVEQAPKFKHIIAVAWHAMVLATFMDEHPDKDDRYRRA